VRQLFFGDFPTAVGTIAGFLVIGFVIVAPFVSPYNPNTINALLRLSPPSWAHPFGTDELGRDVFLRLAVGGRLSLVCAIIAVAASGAVGLVVGGFAGYVGSVLDLAVMRLADAFQGFPQLLLGLVIAFSMGGGMVSATVAIAVAYWPYFAKISRNLIVSLRSSLYVQSAIAAGAGTVYTVRRHLLPQLFAPLLTQMTMAVGEAIIAISGLSLIGLGAQEPTAEWGAMIAESLTFVIQDWWFPFFAGLPLFLACFSFNLLGDSLRQTLYARGSILRITRRTGIVEQGAPASISPIAAAGMTADAG
jgi:peptide/nickel transport system permease protein